MDKILTPKEWLEKNYPYAIKRIYCTKYMQEYAEYYAAFPKWINVKDRLPEVQKCVLAHIYGYTVSFVAEYIPDINEWLTEDGETFNYRDITHWQPLPELLALTEQNQTDERTTSN